MNKKKQAESVAQEWLDQKPSPNELPWEAVNKVAVGLGFELKKRKSHTANYWKHECLMGDPNFSYGILKIFCGHTKGSKKVVRTGSVKPLLKALNIYMENQK